MTCFPSNAKKPHKILQLVQKGAINISALKTHLGSQLSLKESKIVCDVMNVRMRISYMERSALTFDDEI